MRRLTQNDMVKRGCRYCLDYRKSGNNSFKGCIHDECPYHELDDVKDYKQYEKSIEGNSTIEAYLKKLFSLSDFVR